MSEAVSLPPRPSLEQYKKLARDFQQACKSSDAHPVREWARRWAENIARLRGEEITTHVRREVDRTARQTEQRWVQLKKTHDGAGRCTLAAAQFFVARESGFASWPKFSAHLKALVRAHSRVSNFEAAADAIVSGDLNGLRKLLAEDPGLVRARSTRDHHSTLLHYVSANGVEDFRQRTPKNIAAITKLLIEAGCEVNAESDAYGGGCTALGLTATSMHPQRAGVQIVVMQTLLDYGAKIDLPSPAGNRHSMVKACLENGQPEAAEFFANLGVPLKLHEAAAVGKLDRVRRYLDAKPDTAESETESAFLYACGFGRKDVAEFLLNRRVDPNARDRDGRTALHAAAYGAHAEVVKLLLDHGTRVDVKEKGYDATPLDVALWIWTNRENLAERCYEIVAMLTRTGVKFDPEQWRDPESGACRMLESIRSDPRMLEAIRAALPNRA